MKILFLLALGLGSTVAFAEPGHFQIFDPDFQFECPPEQTSSCETPPLRTGNDCKFGLLTNGEASLAARLETIKHAKQSIRIQALVFAADECGKYIAQRLLELKKQNPNLKIEVIVDALSNLFPGGDPATAVKLSADTQEMYNYLEAQGIPVKGDPRQLSDDATKAKNLAILNKRFHDKMWIVDGEDPVNGVAITGGMNIACDYFRMGPGAKHTWRDQDTMQKGAIVADITRTFDGNFKYFEELEQTRPECFQDPRLVGAWNKWVNLWHHKVVEPLEKVNDITKRIAQLDRAGAAIDSRLDGATCRFVQNRPRFKEQYILSTYLDMIQNSSKEIIISNAYFIPTPELIDALKQAARDGKKIRIITNSYETNDLNQMTYASRAIYKTLMEVNSDPETKAKGGGIRIFEWQGHKPGEKQTDGTSHAKFAAGDCLNVIDGSYNLDPRSQNLNSETIMVAKSRKRGRELCDQFEKEDLARSTEITWDQAVDWNDPQKLKDGINLELSERFKGQF